MGAYDSHPNAVEISPATAVDAAGWILTLQATVLSHYSLPDSACAFAMELAARLHCERISIGLLSRNTVAWIADSTTATEPDRSAESPVIAAMNECYDQRSTVTFPLEMKVSPMITLAHQRLAGAAGGYVCSIPMINLERVAGVITFERRAPAFTRAELTLMEDAASFAGPLFALKREAQRPWWARLLDALRAHAAALLGPGHLRSKAVFYGAIGLLAAGSLVPLPYRISAPARLEGSLQRVIVAPADGFLRQANVRAGDKVKAGQVLAELAAEDMQLEKAKRESELRQHENAYKSAMARSDRAQMVIHQAKAGEAQAMLALVDGQLDRGQIQAPFDGVIIKGDLAQNLGAPVQRGEVLLTIAPSDSFRLIVEIDEADIAAIQPGQQGQLVLAAQPDKTLAFEVVRIVPVATAADARNYFDVEARVDASGSGLRPGLRGIAKIQAGNQSLIWNLLHKPWAWLRLQLWSASP